MSHKVDVPIADWGFCVWEAYDQGKERVVDIEPQWDMFSEEYAEIRDDIKQLSREQLVEMANDIPEMPAYEEKLKWLRANMRGKIISLTKIDGPDDTELWTVEFERAEDATFFRLTWG